MQRRDFLLSMLMMSAFSCSGCSMRFNDEESDDESKELKVAKNRHFESIEFPLCYHCNISCAYCSHFAPIAPTYFMPVEVFEKDLKRLKELDTTGEIKFLKLLGGEPLMHKDIDKFIEILAKIFPDRKKSILTNGVLLTEMSDKFWDLCRHEKVSIKITRYPVADSYFESDEFKKLTDKHSDLIAYAKKSNNISVREFRKMNLNKNYKDLDLKNYENCPRKINNMQLDNGKLSTCCIIAYIKFFNQKFPQYALPISENDFIDIYKASSIQELIEYGKRDKDFCKYCHNGLGVKSAPWKTSKFEVSEWYNV